MTIFFEDGPLRYPPAIYPNRCIKIDASEGISANVAALDLLSYKDEYLNQIYEMFGVKWNTDWENTCIEYEPKKQQITLGIARENENGFDIDIL